MVPIVKRISDRIDRMATGQLQDVKAYADGNNQTVEKTKEGNSAITSSPSEYLNNHYLRALDRIDQPERSYAKPVLLG